MKEEGRHYLDVLERACSRSKRRSQCMDRESETTKNG